MALLEDLGRAGDLTTDAIVPAARRATHACWWPASPAWSQVSISPGSPFKPDRSRDRGEDRARRRCNACAGRSDRHHLRSRARGILTAERVALNFLCRLSGIASATADVGPRRFKGTGTGIVCTRKTTPGLRALEKYAVRAGGGGNHRFGLDDAMLIKDNHVAIAGGVTEALKRSQEKRRPSRQDRTRSRYAGAAPRSPRPWRRRRIARQHARSGNPDQGGRNGRRTLCGDGGLWPHHACHRACGRRHRRRPDLDRLADPQRQHSRYRTGFSRLVGRGQSHRLRENRATSSTCRRVPRNWSTGVTPSML